MTKAHQAITNQNFLVDLHSLVTQPMTIFPFRLAVHPEDLAYIAQICHDWDMNFQVLVQRQKITVSHDLEKGQAAWIYLGEPYVNSS